MPNTGIGLLDMAQKAATRRKPREKETDCSVQTQEPQCLLNPSPALLDLVHWGAMAVNLLPSLSTII